MPNYSLLNDIIFKIVFGTDANRPLLRALLNALLDLTGSQRISELTILNPWIDKDYLADKDAILDVRARDAAGRLYNIEVQLTSQRGGVGTIKPRFSIGAGSDSTPGRRPFDIWQ